MDYVTHLSQIIKYENLTIVYIYTFVIKFSN